MFCPGALRRVYQMPLKNWLWSALSRVLAEGSTGRTPNTSKSHFSVRVNILKPSKVRRVLTQSSVLISRCDP
jgi:hypothetical protein